MTTIVLAACEAGVVLAADTANWKLGTDGKRVGEPFDRTKLYQLGPAAAVGIASQGIYPEVYEQLAQAYAAHAFADPLRDVAAVAQFIERCDPGARGSFLLAGFSAALNRCFAFRVRVPFDATAITWQLDPARPRAWCSTGVEKDASPPDDPDVPSTLAEACELARQFVSNAVAIDPAHCGGFCDAIEIPHGGPARVLPREPLRALAVWERPTSDGPTG